MLHPEIRCIIGLGNYPAEYSRHRHNAGSSYITRLASESGVALKQVSRLPVEAAKVAVGSHQLLIGTLRCYMNLSGKPAQDLTQYYGIAAENTAIVFDEIDLEPGRIKIMTAGSSSSHNGIADIRRHLGTAPYLIRVGVGRPPHSSQVKSYVLKPAPSQEQERIEAAGDRLTNMLPLLCAGELDKARDQLHRPLEQL